MPDTTPDLKKLIERILKVTPRYNDVFNNGIPGYGAVNIGADPAKNLQRAALQFAHAYHDSKTKPEALTGLASDLEGAIMVAETFEIIAEKNTTELVDMLHHLMQSLEKRVE
jgi:hypothetical protein